MPGVYFILKNQQFIEGILEIYQGILITSFNILEEREVPDKERADIKILCYFFGYHKHI